MSRIASWGPQKHDRVGKGLVVFVPILGAGDQIQAIVHYYVTCCTNAFQWTIGIQVLKVCIHLDFLSQGFFFCALLPVLELRSPYLDAMLWLKP